MAEPLARRLRTARPRGLTSPAPVRTPTPQGHPTQIPAQEPRTSRTTGERRDAHAPIHQAELRVQESSRKRATAIHRWIEAKRAVQRGTLSRIAGGIYTPVTASPPEDTVRRHLWRIVAHELPGAVIADRSVPAGGIALNGALYVVHPRRRPLSLPGVIVYPRSGPGPQPGDMSLPDNLWISSPERALLDNLASPPPSTPGRTLTRRELEEWVDKLIRQRGEDGINDLRDNARQLADVLHRRPQFRELDRLISAALATHDGDVPLKSPQLRARATGQPYDERRIRGFADLAATLTDLPPDVLPDLPEYRDRRHLLPFYEAYFSNFIEGTEFTVDEAADIVSAHRVPEGRPQDAHDILGTYQIVSDPVEMATVPRTPDGLVELLRERHATLIGARPDKNPGTFKTRSNRAGATEFVAPELTEGTLRQGFEAGSRP